MTVHRVDASDLTEHRRLLVTPGLSVEVVESTIQLPRPKSNRQTAQAGPRGVTSFLRPGIEVVTLPEDRYLLIWVPLAEANRTTRQRAAVDASEALAMLELLFPGSLGERVFEDIVCTPNAFVLLPETPISLGASQVNRVAEMEQKLKECWPLLDALAEEDRSRFQLASRWFTRALGSTNPIDRYLGMFVSLEVFPALGERKVANKTADYLSEKVFDGIGRSEVKRRLPLGRMEDLRGRIVHKGVAFVSEDDREFSASIRLLELVAASCLRLQLGLPALPALLRLAATQGQ